MPLPYTTGLIGRFRAQDIAGLSDGDSIVTWDGIASSEQAASSVSGRRPVYYAQALGNKPGVWFGASKGMRTGVSVSNGDYTIFAVYAQQMAGLAGRMIQGRPANWLMGTYHTSSTSNVRGFNGAFMDSGLRANGIPIVHTMRATGTGTGMYINGSLVASNANITGPSEVCFGNDGQFNESAYAVLFEVLIYDHDLADSDREDVEAFLASEYVLSPFTTVSGGPPLDMPGSAGQGVIVPAIFGSEGTIEAYIRMGALPAFGHYDAWVGTAADNPQGSFSHQAGFDNTGLAVARVVAGGTFALTGNTTFSLDTWYRLSLAWDDGGTADLYVNGVLQDSASIGTSTLLANFWFGSDGNDTGSLPFDGLMCDLRVWNVKRSQAEIAAVAHSRLVGNESGLLRYVPLGNGSGISPRIITLDNHCVNARIVGSAAWSAEEDPFGAPNQRPSAPTLDHEAVAATSPGWRGSARWCLGGPRTTRMPSCGTGPVSSPQRSAGSSSTSFEPLQRCSGRTWVATHP